LFQINKMPQFCKRKDNHISLR